MSSKLDYTVVLFVDDDHRGFLDRARAHVIGQTIPPTAIEIIDNVFPETRAWAELLPKVTTPFIMHLDADTILDSNAVERLSAFMGDPKAGMVYGTLKDAMYGQYGSTRLYGTQAMREAQEKRTSERSPDSDLIRALEELGYKSVVAVEVIATGMQKLLVGVHAPDWTAEYAFRHGYRRGAKLRQRGDARTAIDVELDILRKQSHANWIMVFAGMMLGIYDTDDVDVYSEAYKIRINKLFEDSKFLLISKLRTAGS